MWRKWNFKVIPHARPGLDLVITTNNRDNIIEIAWLPHEPFMIGVEVIEDSQILDGK